MKLKLFNSEIEYSVEEIGILNGQHYVKISIEDCEKNSFEIDNTPYFTKARSYLTILISKKTFDELLKEQEKIK